MLTEPQTAGGASRVSPPSGSEARAVGLQVRLASTPEEIGAAQALRCKLLSARRRELSGMAGQLREYDFDPYDEVAEHLLIIDPARGGLEGLVGTCRLIRGRRARTPGIYLPAPGFPASTKFDLGALLHCPGEIVELGPICIRQRYLGPRTTDLMWQGVAAYVQAFNVGVVFGCASFDGHDPAVLAEPLSLLYHRRLAAPRIRPRAYAQRHVPMHSMPLHRMDERRAVAAMPPLLKSYLRLGAMFGDGAVTDYELNAVEVCAVVPAALLTQRYRRRHLRWGGAAAP